MKRVVRSLTIGSLRSRIAILKMVCDGYSMQTKDGTLSQERKAEVARLWGAALKEARALQYRQDTLEVEEGKTHERGSDPDNDTDDDDKN